MDEYVFIRNDLIGNFIQCPFRISIHTTTSTLPHDEWVFYANNRQFIILKAKKMEAILSVVLPSTCLKNKSKIYFV